MEGRQNRATAASRRPSSWWRRTDRFVRDYTAGLRAADIKRLFDREAVDILEVLGREHRQEAVPEGGFKLLWYRARILFLGLSYRLTPSRRLLFCASLFCALLGVLDFGFALDFRGRVVFDASPLWFVFSVLGLTFLLGLELVDQVRVRDELEVARELQRALLPDAPPTIPGYRITSAYRTAKEVGGDYYDFQQLPDGRLAILVGDASGHGIAAGLLMAIANATLKLAVDLDPRPEAVLALLNRALCRTGNQRAFMSLFYGLLEPESGHLCYAIAGHPFPLLRRAGIESSHDPQGATVEELGSGSFPLGLKPGLTFTTEDVHLEEEDVLVLYSDGLPEAVNEQDQSFGYDRLRSLVAEGSNPEIARDLILHAFDRHLKQRPLEDDFSLVVLGRVTTPPLPS